MIQLNFQETKTLKTIISENPMPPIPLSIKGETSPPNCAMVYPETSTSVNINYSSKKPKF